MNNNMGHIIDVGLIAAAVLLFAVGILHTFLPVHARQIDSCRRFYDKAVEFASTAYVPDAYTKHNPHDTQLSMMYSQLYLACVIAASPHSR